jgi:hypothetical protein
LIPEVMKDLAGMERELDLAFTGSLDPPIFILAYLKGPKARLVVT